MLEKGAYFCKSGPKSSHSSFYLHTKLGAKTLQNRPIWSYWYYNITTAKLIDLNPARFGIVVAPDLDKVVATARHKPALLSCRTPENK